MNKPKETTAFFNLEMKVDCPYCDEEIDLEYDDSGKWLNAYKDWINNKEGADKPNIQEQCEACGLYFKITNIAR